MKCRDEICGVGMQAAEQAEFSSIDCWHPGESKCKLRKENSEHVWLITVSLIKHTQKRDDSCWANHEMKTSVWKRRPLSLPLSVKDQESIPITLSILGWY